MNAVRFRWILYVIVVVILGTICVQVYWNYKNYLSNKQRLINDVQLSLDHAVETYFAHLAQTKTLALAFNSHKTVSDKAHMDSIIHELKRMTKNFPPGDSLKIAFNDNSHSRLVSRASDTFNPKTWQTNKIVIKDIENTVSPDTLGIKAFGMLTSKVIVSMTSDSLQLTQIDSLLKKELQSKQLEIPYNLSFQNATLEIQHINNTRFSDTPLTVNSSSNYLPLDSSLNIQFSNITQMVLKRILSSILISTLLVIAVISCLFYLLRIIKHQKQLAEVKNDLISNITHEFKTPIATIGVALEGIRNFNVIEDKDKTKAYVEMSSAQLHKLNTMVEKLLETATLDSESLELHKEPLDILELLTGLLEHYKVQNPQKQFIFKTGSTKILAQVDAFHMENAINNILDNAVKYGGDTINVEVSADRTTYGINISDNGTALKETHKDKIFEKFYRVPKGNTHDVKGFGIGLYYTRKIIEKHNGHIVVHVDPKGTQFKITLPNE
ncbi:sensor histidine kinase [Aestuariivivens sediminis]|uniref:sensor histidine kinase n=1 Tax=Aestuariivivens sediminis TaxID=2913557 RepID=UPI001F59C162|nr:HAMP domain-containing sensor histidine kinase [Aestuariivivens sediminis]